MVFLSTFGLRSDFGRKGGLSSTAVQWRVGATGSVVEPSGARREVGGGCLLERHYRYLSGQDKGRAVPLVVPFKGHEPTEERGLRPTCRLRSFSLR